MSELTNEAIKAAFVNDDISFPFFFVALGCFFNGNGFFFEFVSSVVDMKTIASNKH